MHRLGRHMRLTRYRSGVSLVWQCAVKVYCKYGNKELMQQLRAPVADSGPC